MSPTISKELMRSLLPVTGGLLLMDAHRPANGPRRCHAPGCKRSELTSITDANTPYELGLCNACLHPYGATADVLGPLLRSAVTLDEIATASNQATKRLRFRAVDDQTVKLTSLVSEHVHRVNIDMYSRISLAANTRRLHRGLGQPHGSESGPRQARACSAG